MHGERSKNITFHPFHAFHFCGPHVVCRDVVCLSSSFLGLRCVSTRANPPSQPSQHKLTQDEEYVPCGKHGILLQRLWLERALAKDMVSHSLCLISTLASTLACCVQSIPTQRSHNEMFLSCLGQYPGHECIACYFNVGFSSSGLTVVLRRCLGAYYTHGNPFQPDGLSGGSLLHDTARSPIQVLVLTLA